MKKWTAEAINKWWELQKWPVGANFVTTSAVNDIEMWMDSTFNPELVRKELKIAAEAGLNSVRVFLSYIVWREEGELFEKNFDAFLQMAHEAGLTVMPILFDDCAFDYGSEPVYGPQPDPVPGVHNSRWVPSPGFAIQDNPAQLEACKAYVDAIVGKHSKDPRIIVWDLYNEAGNTARCEMCLPLAKRAFEWARENDPIQPLTIGPYDFSEKYSAVNEFMFEHSDIISVHTYSDIEGTKKVVELAQKYGRPVLVTEWMHRPNGSTIPDILPYFKEQKVGCWQWGIIKGRTQTNLNWKTMNGGTPEPDPVLWQHDILHPDGTPYRPEEIELIRKLQE